MAEENTEITVVVSGDTTPLEQDLRKVNQLAQKTAKAQVTSEKQSVTAQKTAARVADTTRRDSNRDLANQTRSKRLAEQREERVRRAERGHEKESKKSFREKAKHYAEVTKQRREEVKAARQLRDIETDTVKRRNKQGAFASRGGGASGGGGGAGSAAGGMTAGRMAAGAVGAIGGVVLAGIGAYLGAALTQLNDGVQLYKKYAVSKADLTGMSGLDRLENSETISRAQAMGYSQLDTAGQAGVIGRLTGRIGAVNTAQEFTRASGATFDQVGSMMGTLTRGGQQFDERGGGAGRRQMALMFRDAVTSGLDRSRTGEHLEAVSSVIQNVGGRTSGDVNGGGISAMLAWLGSTGRSGFQGARGANFLSGIDQGISSGGRDDSAQAIALQAMGFGAGGNNNYLDAVAQRERGIFGEGGAKNLDAIMTRYQVGTGGGDAMIGEMRASGHFGNASVDQLRAFTEEYNKLKASGDEGGIERLISDMQAQGADIQTQILEATKGGNLKMVTHLAAMDNRSLEHGAKLIQSVTDMENMFNRLMDWGIPTIISGINALVELALRIESALPGADARAKASSDENLKSLENRLTEVNTMSGSLGARERQKLLEDIETEQRTGLRGLDPDSVRAMARVSLLKRSLQGTMNSAADRQVIQEEHDTPAAMRARERIAENAAQEARANAARRRIGIPETTNTSQPTSDFTGPVRVNVSVSGTPSETRQVTTSQQVQTTNAGNR